MHMEQYKVFVGNLPYTFDEEQLKTAFITNGEFAEEDILEVIILREKTSAF